MSDTNYQQALVNETRDLLAEARRDELPRAQFRDQAVAQIGEHLASGHSVLVTGPAGVGKTAVIHELAHVFLDGGRGGLREMSTTTALVGTRYVGEWQTKITRMIEAAEADDVTLVISDVWNLATAGKASNDPTSLWDAVRPFLESRRLKLVGEATPEVLHQMQRLQGFTNHFKQVALQPLEPAEVDAVLQHAGGQAGLALDEASRQALVKVTGRFTPARPQPGPALDLLAQVRDYGEQKRGVGEPEPVTPAFVEKVFCIYSGLPRFVVSRDETMAVRDIRAWFSDRIVGQTEAIEAVVETITLFKAGLHDPQRPIGTFLFVGPTGVGKTELARALARFLFGSTSRMLRFDLSEFKDYHSFEMLLGNPREPGSPARLLDPVRQQPFQVVLLDELEKAHSNVWDIFLQLLDEGRLTPPGGQPVSFRNTLLIATSNVGNIEADSRLGFGKERSATAREMVVRKALESAFRPEFLNRFAHVVVFHPLTREQVRTVARQELQRILGREGITARNLVVDVDDSAIDLAIDRGYDQRYGARALKREIQRQIVKPLAVALMERGVEPGAILRVVAGKEQVQVRLVETAESRAAKREREPVKLPAGEKLTRPLLEQRLAATRAEVDAIAASAAETELEAERDRLLALQADPDFWGGPAERTASVLTDLDRCNQWLDRIDHLRAWATELCEDLATSPLRRDVERIAPLALRLERALAFARRELVVMGAAGRWDALIEIRPLGGAGGRPMRDLLVETYTRWAEFRDMQVDWVCEPMTDAEPVLLSVQGHFAYGLLRGEAGLHRLREDELRSVASVRVAAWTPDRGKPEFAAHRALKTTGQFGGRIRSRQECTSGLVLQNTRTLADNREWAAELGPSWLAADEPPGEIVRRYDLAPFKLRDPLTGTTTGRRDVLQGRPFHELLGARVDAAAEG